MTGFLSARQIRIFDYPRFAEPLRDRVRERATELANTSGVIIEHIAKNHLRKEDVVAQVLAARGDHPGLVHIISAMEACDSYKPWHDKQTHRTFLRPDTGKCLHYYFYFMDAELGLIYLRVPTPACAGAGSGVRSASSSIATGIAGWPANSPPPGSVSPLPTTPSCTSTTGRARRPSPIASRPTTCIASWTAMPSSAVRCSTSSLSPTIGVSCRSSTPLIWCSARKPSLKPLYEQLSRQAILTVKAEHVAPFLGHKTTPQPAQEIGSQFTTRIEGTCVKHRFGRSSIKIYDKFALVLRIETTTNDVSAFKTTARACPRGGGGGTSAGRRRPRPCPRP